MLLLIVNYITSNLLSQGNIYIIQSNLLPLFVIIEFNQYHHMNYDYGTSYADQLSPHILRLSGSRIGAHQTDIQPYHIQTGVSQWYVHVFEWMVMDHTFDSTDHSILL